MKKLFVMILIVSTIGFAGCKKNVGDGVEIPEQTVASEATEINDDWQWGSAGEMD